MVWLVEWIRDCLDGLASRVDQRLFRWFGHEERMNKCLKSRRMLMAEVSRGRVRGRPM